MYPRTDVHVPAAARDVAKRRHRELSSPPMSESINVRRSYLFALERQAAGLLTVGDVSSFAEAVRTIAGMLPASPEREHGEAAASALSAQDLSAYRRSAALHFAVEWLRALHKSCSFAPEPSPIDDARFATFLRVALREDEKLVGPEALEIANVGRRAKLGPEVLDLALARAFDEGLVYFTSLDDKLWAVLLAQDDARGVLEELAIGSHLARPASAPPERPGTEGAQMITRPPGPRVDVGILTIKEEEFEAVLEAFPDEPDRYVGPTSHRHYNLRSASAGSGATYRVAIVRQLEQGTGEAQDAARDMIEELDPELILVVGIAGGVPSDDLTLGDVVLSLRIHDLTVHAKKQDAPTEYAIAGGRTKFADHIRSMPDCPEKTLLAKVERGPAAETLKHLTTPLAFWFIIDFPDGEQACMALGGVRPGTGSSELS
jgi:hypothetical protein